MKTWVYAVVFSAIGCGSSKDEDAPDCAAHGALVTNSETCEESEAVYEASCEDDYSDAKALGCGEESAAMIACAIAAEYEYDCTDDGDPSMVLSDDDPCESEFNAMFDCALGGVFGG